VTRIGHQLLGATCGLALAAVATLSPFEAMAVAIVAAGTATLPDIDQRRWWRKAFGHIGALQHRRLTHWWGLPTSALLLFFVAHGPLAWLLGAALTGWFSHLAGDWAYGKRGPAVTGWRGAGIPLAPWWGYHGLGWRCGGAGERYGAWPVLSGALVVQAAVLTGVA
jgi:LexA-binding, inner membrane-associated putative hydrolase